MNNKEAVLRVIKSPKGRDITIMKLDKLKCYTVYINNYPEKLEYIGRVARIGRFDDYVICTKNKNEAALSDIPGIHHTIDEAVLALYKKVVANEASKPKIKTIEPLETTEQQLDRLVKNHNEMVGKLDIEINRIERQDCISQIREILKEYPHLGPVHLK